MATLTANITADETLIPLSAEVENGYYSIDSENIYVTGMSRGADGREFVRRWASVDRGVGGSTAATHNSAVTLTRYYPDAASSAGVQTVTLIGPYPIDWTQEADLTGDGVELAELPSGCAVIRAWAEVTAQWNGAGSPGGSDYVMIVGVGTAAVGMVTATSYSQWNGYEPTALPGVAVENPPSTGGVNLSVVRVTDDGLFLMAQFQNFAGALSVGSADIYALIGVPA